MWQRRLTKIHFWVQSEQDQKIKRQIGYQWDNSLNFLKNKYRRRANLWNRQRIPDFRSSLKDTELLLPRTQTSLSRAQRKAGRRHRARRRFACPLYPSHGTLQLITSRSPPPCEKRSAWGGGYHRVICSSSIDHARLELFFGITLKNLLRVLIPFASLNSP